MKFKIAILDSHPIQYNTPLFNYLASDPDIDLTVYYCFFDEKGVNDLEFGKQIKWDIPLFDGYKYKILKNYSFRPSLYRFWGLVNIDIIRELKKNDYDALIIYGWNHFTQLIAIIFAKILGIEVIIRGDNPLIHEHLKSKWKIRIKKVILRILFEFVDVILYVGYENNLFYKYYGVSEKKLIFAPHSVDNDRFRNKFLELKDKKLLIKNEIGLSNKDFIILFVGKLIDKKIQLIL
ncbi:MAG: hypothetical protein QXH07_07755 [Thermoplasmata archaeon]